MTGGRVDRWRGGSHHSRVDADTLEWRTLLATDRCGGIGDAGRPEADGGVVQVKKPLGLPSAVSSSRGGVLTRTASPPGNWLNLTLQFVLAEVGGR